MKAFIHKVLMLVICTSALAIVPARAQSYQLEEKTLPVGEFSSVSVSGDFEVTLVKGAYSVKVTTYQVLAPYLQVFVRSKTLYISYDEKSVPKDTRKIFKGRGAPTQVFRAVVYLPELNGISLEDNVTLSSTDEFSGNGFTMSLDEKAQVKGLNLRATNISVNMKKNAQASSLNLKADNRLEINTEGNANLKGALDSPEMAFNTSGASLVAINGGGKNATFNMNGTSNVTATMQEEKTVLNISGNADLRLIGSSDNMIVTADKSAEIEANDYAVKKVEAKMNGGAKLNANVTEQLDATLVNGASFYYTGTPAITIGKIIKSTLAPYGSTAK
ncbi:MAG: DUF2807 domain-containing protein [Bacteroidales bacterium]|nr:DUF2807 domain-containing protein [Bacteroidales bacterium]